MQAAVAAAMAEATVRLRLQKTADLIEQCLEAKGFLD